MFAMGFYKWASGRVGSPQTSFSCCMNFLIFEAVFLFFFFHGALALFQDGAVVLRKAANIIIYFCCFVS